MSCPRFCVPCCYCCFCCCPCAQRWFAEKAPRRKSFIEYGRHTPDAFDSSEWPTKDQRVPIHQVLADTPDVPQGYGLDPVTQQPRLFLGSPASRSAARRRQSQPVLPGTRGVHSQPTSPYLGRRVSHPAMPVRSGSQPPGTTSPLESPHHSAARAGRRRSVQMTSLHEDFYSESEGSSDEEEEEEGLLSHTDITASDYETSVTSEEGEEDDSMSMPLLSTARHHTKPKHTSTIPQIVVTEPFEIGPNPTLQFSLYYDFKRRTLIVHLQKGFNLPAREVNKDTCNAFVIIYLLPNRETDRETYESSVIQNTLNPNFDEMFQFPRLKQEVARQQTLVFRIYHQCGPKHNILVGGVLQPLEGVDFHGKTMRKRIVEDVEECQVCFVAVIKLGLIIRIPFLSLGMYDTLTVPLISVRLFVGNTNSPENSSVMKEECCSCNKLCVNMCNFPSLMQLYTIKWC